MSTYLERFTARMVGADPELGGPFDTHLICDDCGDEITFDHAGWKNVCPSCIVGTRCVLHHEHRVAWDRHNSRFGADVESVECHQCHTITARTDRLVARDGEGAS